MEIRALRESDDRSTFDSGDADLDRFFRNFAGQNRFKHHIGVTYVAVEGRALLGYVTVAPGEIEVEGLPASARKRLPRYPLPILRLARLAVERTVRAQGVGSALLRFVLELALRMTADYGCVGIVVDAKAQAEGFYSRYGFVRIDLVEGAAATRPAPIAMFLSTGEIRRARS